MIFDQFTQIRSSAASSRLGFEPTILTFHWTGGWRDAEAVAKIDYQRAQNRVSAHFTIGRGEEDIVQSVDTELAAWHVSRKLRFQDGKKRANQRSIGVEVCNRGFLRGDDWSRLGPDQIFRGRHPNPRARRDEWERYTDAQAQSVEHLTWTLFRAIPSLKWICGHSDWCEGRPGSKLDPGPAFPWDLVRWPERAWVLTYNYGERVWDRRLTEAA